MKIDMKDIRRLLEQAVGSTRDPELTNDVLNAVEAALSDILATVRKEERDEIVARLESLGEGRMEYVANRHPKHSGEIEAMGGMQATIYGEATGAKWLARIIRGESDRGWLPSWRWSS